MPEEQKPRIDPKSVQPGKSVQRRPYGRWCTVVKLNDERTKLLIRDGSRCFWMNMATLVNDWA